jgi:hypothetical protein
MVLNNTHKAGSHKTCHVYVIFFELTKRVGNVWIFIDQDFFLAK